ncbi:MAG: hypothetical protein AAF415_11925 [Pseudomonadota bacterium]
MTRHIRVLPFALISAMVLSGCAAITTDAMPPRQVDKTFVGDGATWRDGGGILVSVKAFEEQGKVAVCGLRAQKASRSNPSVDLNPWMLQNMRVELGDEIIFSDVGAFPNTTWVDDQYPSGRAACFLTSTAWKPGFENKEARIELARTKYTYYD